MIRLIASDLDGTIVSEGTDHINPKYYSVIRALKEKGILFAAASGRHYTSMRRLFEPVMMDMVFISANGARVMSQNRTLMEEKIPDEYVEEWVTEARKIPHTHIILDTKKGFLTESRDEAFLHFMIHGYHNEMICTEDVLRNTGSVVKLGIHLNHGIDELYEIMYTQWKTRLECVISGTGWIDLTMPGVHKGTALSGIQKHYGIRPEETIVFGDNKNDLGMLAYAGAGYAVANAVEEMKKNAARVIPAQEEDGVLRILEEVLESAHAEYRHRKYSCC
ncbi:MAG: HAD family hydrolase [Lachnospiraceae bacterium]|nr:HAD family hydrolase [Lachnospiraceae bacterium]